MKDNLDPFSRYRRDEGINSVELYRKKSDSASQLYSDSVDWRIFSRQLVPTRPSLLRRQTMPSSQSWRKSWRIFIKISGESSPILVFSQTQCQILHIPRPSSYGATSATETIGPSTGVWTRKDARILEGGVDGIADAVRRFYTHISGPWRMETERRR